MNTHEHAAVPEHNTPGNQLVPKEQSTLASLREAALGDLWQQQLQDLEGIAAQVKSVGAIQIMRGRALVNQQRLDAVMQALTAKILSLGRKRRTSRGDVALIAKLTHSLAQLSGKTTDSQRLLVEMEKPTESKPGPHVPEIPLNKSFAPGQKVGRYSRIRGRCSVRER